MAVLGFCAVTETFLSHLPVAVLYGVVLYLGITNITRLQLLDRFVLLFIPSKYFPNVPYCRKVSRTSCTYCMYCTPS